MPLFSNLSSNNVIPDVDQGEVPNEELPKQDGKRRLSIKKSFFTWSSQKQYIDKNKFLFDSCSVIPIKDKKNIQNNYIVKSNKYATSHSSLNYDESENEYSSGSDLNVNEETIPKDYYSMEDFDNITALKTKPPKIRKVAPLSESTLCYSSNTNTINTVSLEFNGKNNKIISNNDENGGIAEETINYGFEENPNIEEAINNGFAENPNSEDDEKLPNHSNNPSEEYEAIDSSDNEDDDSDDEDDESSDEVFTLPSYSYNRKASRKSTANNTTITTITTTTANTTNTLGKKTVTFCDDIVIIEPKTQGKAKNIFKRAIKK